MSARERLERRTQQYQSRRGQTDPPAESGERLATFSRGENELRWVWDRYEGHGYLMAREWTAAGFPTKRGITVRRAELAEVAEVIMQAMDRAEADSRNG